VVERNGKLAIVSVSPDSPAAGGGRARVGVSGAGGNLVNFGDMRIIGMLVGLRRAL
jgi:hypothetical protein